MAACDPLTAKLSPTFIYTRSPVKRNAVVYTVYPMIYVHGFDFICFGVDI